MVFSQFVFRHEQLRHRFVNIQNKLRPKKLGKKSCEDEEIGHGMYLDEGISPPQIEIEQKQQEEIDKELKEKQAKEEAEQALNTCIANAEENYHDRWYRECKAQGKLTSKCIDINELSYDEYLTKYGLTTEEYVNQRNLTPSDPSDPVSIRLSATWDYITRKSDECSCRLLVSTADRFNESLEKDKAECFKRYPQQ